MANHPARQSAPTIRDIAERVGVHKATVSAVLNGGRSTARVSEATRARIVAAANELQYVPNAMARALKVVQFRSLGLVFHYRNPAWIMGDEFGVALMSGIIAAATELEYNVTHFHKTWQEGMHSAAGFRGQGIDGYVVIAPIAGSAVASRFTEIGIPVVLISAVPEIPDIPYVILDNRQGVRLALDHLLGLGHTKIALITSGFRQYDIVERTKAYREIMGEAGIALRPEFLIDLDNIPGEPRIWDGPENMYVEDSAYIQAQRLIRLTEPPTAVITAGARAEPVLYAARAGGIRVPDDLSIIGFDDTAGARYMSPPITTIRQPLQRMAECAGRVLISLVEHAAIQKMDHVFNPELLERQSTARPSH
jgi:DNA-binding LacI/PurR family transcriptional regulator